MAKLAIKSDNRKQNLLLPPSLDELVPENHMVRVVDAVIDRLDISDILLSLSPPPQTPAKRLLSGSNHKYPGVTAGKIVTSNKTQHRLQLHRVVADVAIL